MINVARSLLTRLYRPWVFTCPLLLVVLIAA